MVAPTGLNVVSGKVSNKIFNGNLMRIFVDVGASDEPVIIELPPEDVKSQTWASR